MSRIGRAPIEIPNNVNVEIQGNKVVVSGPLGSLEQEVNKNINVEKQVIDGKNYIVITRKSNEKEERSMHGMYRALINNMVNGVEKGYSKNLTINGVGYKCQIVGNKLVLNIGFSHPVEFVIPKDIKIECPSITEVKVSGFDKTKVGQVAADIRALKPVEPYHAYGIRYTDEVVIKKEGKKASKKK